MPLPILQPSRSHDASPETLVRLFHRTEMHWVRHLSEETQLDAGTAFTNPEMPRVWDANLVIDAAVPEGTSVEETVAEVDQHFAARGVRCLQWIMNPSAPAERTRPLIEHLLSRGGSARPVDIMHLAGQPSGVVREVGGLTIIPARASFRHARALAEEEAARWGEPRLADASMLHLDDPHWDALLALRDGVAVGRAGVLAVGDVGRIDHVFVSERFRRQGIGRTLMSRALEICARSLFRHVMLCVRPDNREAVALYDQLGFRKVAQMVAYHAA